MKTYQPLPSQKLKAMTKRELIEEYKHGVQAANNAVIALTNENNYLSETIEQDELLYTGVTKRLKTVVAMDNVMNSTYDDVTVRQDVRATLGKRVNTLLGEIFEILPEVE